MLRWVKSLVKGDRNSSGVQQTAYLPLSEFVLITSGLYLYTHQNARTAMDT